MDAVPYQSVDHIIDEVRAMRVRGGSAFGQAAAAAFRFVALDPAVETGTQLFTQLNRVADTLLAEKPTMATIHNARALIVDTVGQDPAGAEVDVLKAGVRRRAEQFLQHSLSAVDRLGQTGANLVTDGDTIMMHSFSKSLMSIFDQAYAAGKRFSVICTESRPLREGRFSAHHLSALGVPVTFVTDASMAEIARDADWMVTGADSIAYDGAVANKMGTNLLSIIAAHHGVPFYIASELLKLQPATRDGHPIELEMRPPGEIVEPDSFAEPARVAVRNQFFDLTPPHRIRALITEYGIYAPTQVGEAWRELEATLVRS